jgi:hypothetical protein
LPRTHEGDRTLASTPCTESAAKVVEEVSRLVLPLFYNRLNQFLSSTLGYIELSAAPGEVGLGDRGAVAAVILEHGSRLLTLTRKLLQYGENGIAEAGKRVPVFTTLADIRNLVTELWKDEAQLEWKLDAARGLVLPGPLLFDVAVLAFLTGSLEAALARGRRQIRVAFETPAGPGHGPQRRITITATQCLDKECPRAWNDFVTSRRQRRAWRLLDLVTGLLQCPGWGAEVREYKEELQADLEFPVLTAESAAVGGRAELWGWLERDS